MLIAYPFFGEFGWQLFRWQGMLREKARDHAETIVYCEKGYEYLYQDFASKIIGVPAPLQATRHMLWCAVDGKMHDEYYDTLGADEVIRPGGWLTKTVFEQTFVEYGTQCPKEDIVLFHARNAQHTERNWPIEKWEALNTELENEVICIGTKAGAEHVNGTIDARGISLKELAGLMRRAKVLLTPSSGPAHFATLCRLPHVVWSDTRRWAMRIRNDERYETLWNPFRTPCAFIANEQWNPAVEEVQEAACRYL